MLAFMVCDGICVLEALFDAMLDLENNLFEILGMPY